MPRGRLRRIPKPRRLSRVLALVSGLAFLATLLLPTAASAGPLTFPWNVDTHDYGYAESSYTYVFTNIYPLQIVDYPLPMLYPNAFHVVRDACTAPVAPGGSCAVTVRYTPVGKPVADTLQLKFNDMSGRPVATPSVRLFGGGAEYLTTDFIGNFITFPDTDVATEFVYWIIFHIHGVNPIDLPPIVSSPWSVVGNTCGSLQPGATSCRLGIAFKPTSAGTFSTSFQMPFTDPVSKLPVSVPVVTLQATAVNP